MQGVENKSAFIKNFTGSNRYIVDYLFDEVIALQSEQTREFLLQTSVLDRLSAPLCDAVTQRKDSQQMLDELEKSNLFIFPLDDERQWYRYHHLFGDLLKQRLNSESDLKVSVLYRRASQWFEEQNYINEAVQSALAGENYSRAVSLLENHAESMLMRSEISTLNSMLESLPQEKFLKNPRLCVYNGITLLLNSQPLSVAESRIEAAIKSDTSGEVSGEVAAFRALVASYQGRLKQSVELCRKALDVMPEERIFFRSFIIGFLGLNYLWTGEIKAARKAFQEAVITGKKTGNLMITVLAQCHLAELSVFEADLNKAKTIYEKAFESAIDHKNYAQPIAGVALIGLGNLYREWNDDEKAMRYLERGIELINQWGEIGAMNGYIGLAMIHKNRKDYTTSQKLLKKAQELAENFDAMEFDDIMVANYQALVSIYSGDYQYVKKWIENRNIDPEFTPESIPSSMKLLRIVEFSTLARFYLETDQPEKALQLLDKTCDIIKEAGWTYFELDCYLLRAIAHYKLDEFEDAIISCKKALNLAKPASFLRMFLDFGQPMAGLLRMVLEEDKIASPQDERQFSKSYARKLILAFNTIETAKATQGLPEPLSEREMEVLKLIADGLTNLEIGKQLFISLNTVRTHTKKINYKLDVHSRTQAISKAKQLGIL
jgi:LuxR family maltose regulon positive regulatory protein